MEMRVSVCGKAGGGIRPDSLKEDYEAPDTRPMGV